MTFWDFCAQSPWLTTLVVIIAIVAMENVTLAVVRVAAVSRLAGKKK